MFALKPAQAPALPTSHPRSVPRYGPSAKESEEVIHGNGIQVRRHHFACASLRSTSVFNFIMMQSLLEKCLLVGGLSVNAISQCERTSWEIILNTYGLTWDSNGTLYTSSPWRSL